MNIDNYNENKNVKTSLVAKHFAELYLVEGSHLFYICVLCKTHELKEFFELKHHLKTLHSKELKCDKTNKNVFAATARQQMLQMELEKKDQETFINFVNRPVSVNCKASMAPEAARMEDLLSDQIESNVEISHSGTLLPENEVSLAAGTHYDHLEGYDELYRRGAEPLPTKDMKARIHREASLSNNHIVNNVETFPCKTPAIQEQNRASYTETLIKDPLLAAKGETNKKITEDTPAEILKQLSDYVGGNVEVSPCETLLPRDEPPLAIIPCKLDTPGLSSGLDAKAEKPLKPDGKQQQLDIIAGTLNNSILLGNDVGGNVEISHCETLLQDAFSELLLRPVGFSPRLYMESSSSTHPNENSLKGAMLGYHQHPILEANGFNDFEVEAAVQVLHKDNEMLLNGTVLQDTVADIAAENRIPLSAIGGSMENALESIDADHHNLQDNILTYKDKGTIGKETDFTDTCSKQKQMEETLIANWQDIFKIMNFASNKNKLIIVKSNSQKTFIDLKAGNNKEINQAAANPSENSSDEDEEKAIILNKFGSKNLTQLEPGVYSCNFCQKRFPYRSSARNHVISHNTLNLFKCDVCVNEFKDKRTLKQHQRLHTKEKNIKCPARFYVMNEKSFKCQLCDKSFKRPCALRAHRKLHHPEKLLWCYICQKKFNIYKSLVAHMNIKHNMDVQRE